MDLAVKDDPRQVDFRPAKRRYIALVIAVFVMVLVFGFVKLIQVDKALQRPRLYTLWITSQAEYEFERLVHTLDLFGHRDPDTTHETLVERLDIFWSRILIMTEGSYVGFLHEIEPTKKTLLKIAAALETLEPAIASLKKGDRAAYLDVRGRLVAHQQSLREVVVTTMHLDEESQSREREETRAVYWQLIGSLGGILLIGVIFTFLLFRKTRRADELLHQVIGAERARRESEQRFKDFAAVGADWFWEIDPALNITYLSGRFEEVTGVPPQRILGRALADVFRDHTDDAREFVEYLKNLRDERPNEGHEFAWQHPNADERILRTNCKPIFGAGGEFVGYRGVTRDITEAHSLSKQLSHQASHDALTGLVNRREFEHRLRRVLETTDADHALCYLDLDQFKIINDTCGHVAGDELLRQLAKLLGEQVRVRDTLARLGGDEFGVLMEHCELPQARRVAEKLRKAVCEFRFVWQNKSFDIGVSIGLVPITGTQLSLSDVLSAADAACYVAKDQGRNRVHVYREDDAALTRRHGEMQWVARISRALEENRFELYAQPIAPIGEAVGAKSYFEVLLRMRDEQGELVPPSAFFPAAERYHLSAKLDRWVVEHTFKRLTEHQETLADLSMCSINLSAHAFSDNDVLDFIVRQLEGSRIPAGKICFEITETAAIANLSSASRIIKALKERGCHFALDDFGSGLSSFAYLKNLPVDFLKIDGQFVRDIVDDPIDFAMVRSINEIGKVMGKRSIAEFVENEAILAKLQEIGVDYAQGFGIGRPVPIDSLIFGSELPLEPRPRDLAESADRVRLKANP